VSPEISAILPKYLLSVRLLRFLLPALLRGYREDGYEVGGAVRGRGKERGRRKEEGGRRGKEGTYAFPEDVDEVGERRFVLLEEIVELLFTLVL
jgi:hypothetical protein